MISRRGRRTQAERRAETRQDLITAAVRLWAERPISDVSLDLLADTAGYSRGAFHGNFADKDELVEAVRDSLVEQAANLINHSVDAEADPLAALGDYMRSTAAYVAAQPAQTRALVAISRYQEAHRPLSYADRAAVGAAPIEELLRRGIKSGTIRQLDVTLTARVIQSALDTLVLTDPPADPVAVGDQLATLFTAAVRANP
ncbi:TetR/AcrR family transcriptional regulator [Microlunatus speluncae]|uniref:TetR/AcrR family transcriptional regulator n=1 Tax=Microlunatus speluncae TaxID=2594267 RepID=UPI0013763257|nr:TetR family transcriptional regulator [Microlunatus speluncae]